MSNDKTYRWHWMRVLDDRLYEAFQIAYNESDKEFPPKSVLCDMYFDDFCCIEVEITRSGDVNINAYHKDERNERECPNIEQYIVDNLPSWEEYYDAYCDSAEVFDEWTSHGFRNEDDYWRYRMG